MEYRQCTLSVMDTIADPDITFDDKGICNYYYEYQMASNRSVYTGEVGQSRLKELCDEIKSKARSQQYDSILGLSGGVDSTYVAYWAKKMGLNPLAVHFDNGWNSELSIKNIENIVNKLDIDLYTYVINWEEFKDLQLSYLKASVIDIEVITDHAIFASLYRIAGERNIKYILSGTNVQTENTLPPSWIFSKTDHINIKSIHKKFGSIPLRSFPFMDSKVKRYYQAVKGIRSISVLDWMEYNKNKVKELIKNELAWVDYGGKHYESIWTRFYQGYILPRKFGIDKRKAHLSDLIFSGQLTKPEALAELSRPIYDPALFESDFDFVLKKLGLSKKEWAAIMNQPKVSHLNFDYEKPIDLRYPVLKPFKYLYRKLFPLS